MVLESHWEREKNEAILELERRNKSLESKLRESSKDADAVSSQVEKIQQSIIHTIHAAFQMEFGKNTVRVPVRNESSSGIQEFPSGWEREKNLALLELERRNKELQNLLKSKELTAAVTERENEFVEEGFVRGKEWMRLYAQVRAMQGSLVMQAQRISKSRRLIGVLSGWQRIVMHARRKKTLRKAELSWDHRVLRKSFSVFASERTKANTTKKLVAIARKHRTRTVLQRAFELWILAVHFKRFSNERLAIFNMLQRSRMTRLAFCSWKIFSAVKQCLIRKSRTFFLQHMLQKSLLSWRRRIDAVRIHACEANEFCKYKRLSRSFCTWSKNVEESILVKAQSIRIEQHRKLTLLFKGFKAWQGIAHIQALTQRRLEKAVSSRTRRIHLFTFIAWRQHAKNNREVKLWRKATAVKQKSELRLAAFNFWKRLWTRHRLLRRFKSQQLSRTRLFVLKTWSFTVQKHKNWLHHLRNMANRAQHRQFKDTFHRWLSFVAECRRLALVKDGRVLQARLELSEEDVQGAKATQAVMTEIIKRLEKEKATMMHTIDVIMSRTPPWSSGFLDVDLRWSSPGSSRRSVPSARVGHSAVALHLAPRLPLPSHVVVTGGYNGNAILNDILVFHAVDSTWRTPKLNCAMGGTNTSFQSIQHHTACARQNRIILFGGFNGAEDLSALSVLEFSKDGNSCEWSQPEHSVGILPGPMSQHSSCLSSDGNQMIVFGGYRSNVGHLNELWILDLEWMDWHSPDYYGDPPAPRRGHGAVTIGSKLYIFGGYDGKTNLGDLHALDLGTMEWRLVEHLGEAPTARRHHAMTAVGGKFVVYGGYDGESYLDDVYSFDTESGIWKHWKVFKPKLFTEICRRSMHAMVSFGQRFLVVGGIHEYGTVEGAVYLENGAAVDGLELQRQLVEEKSEVQTLQHNLAQHEEMVREKVADLALAYSKIAECQAALKEEAKERKDGVLKQQVLIQKLRKTRKKSSLW